MLHPLLLAESGNVSIAEYSVDMFPCFEENGPRKLVCFAS